MVEKTRENSYYLTVEYNEPNGNEPSESGFTWKTLCAQSLRDYKTRQQMINRITLMLAQQLASKAQDVNGLFEDYEINDKTRKHK